MTSKSLLIVDDEEELLDILAIELEEHADTIYTAQNGLEALEQLKKHPIDLIISDVNMPEMDGIKLLQELRQQDNDTPFIFYTAYGNEELMLLAADLKAFDFIHKPDFDCLERRVIEGIKEGFLFKKDSTRDTKISDYRRLLAKKLKG